MQRIEISPGAGNESRTRLAKLRDDLDISSNKLTERQASGVENWYLRAMSHRVAELVFSEGERVRKFLARPEVPSYEPPLTVKEVRGPMLAGHATKAS